MHQCNFLKHIPVKCTYVNFKRNLRYKNILDNSSLAVLKILNLCNFDIVKSGLDAYY